MGLPDCLELLRDYVAIPSVNPMGRADMDPGITGERRYAEHVREQLRSLGLDAELVGASDRPSVVAEARVPGATETLMVASHLDTVPVDGMRIDPFDPVVVDGRLYGRGSCDTKPGLACLMDALRRVLEAGTLRRNLVVVGESDEECESRGAVEVAAHLAGRAGAGVGGRAPLPDWALVTEPTRLRVVTAHKGVVRSRLAARGVACHSSDPGRGRNALTSLARAIVALDALAGRLGERRHPELGPPTLSVGLAAGGSAPNVVPEQAWLMFDRRLVPGETAEDARREVEAMLASEGIADVSIAWLAQTKAPLAIPEQHPAVRACLSALEAVGLEARTEAVAFATDGGIFAQRGIPSVVLGAGSIEQAHTADEWVAVAEVEAMARIYRRLLEAPAG